MKMKQIIEPRTDLTSMQCPKCKNGMSLGYLQMQLPRGLSWTPDIPKRPRRTNVPDNYDQFSKLEVSEGLCILAPDTLQEHWCYWQASICKNCEIIIISYDAEFWDDEGSSQVPITCAKQ